MTKKITAVCMAFIILMSGLPLFSISSKGAPGEADDVNLTKNLTAADPSAVRVSGADGIPGHPDLKWWEITKNAGEEPEIAYKSGVNTVSASSIRSFNGLGFYVKISNSNSVNSTELNFELGLEYDNSAVYETVAVTPVTAADAAAGWVKADVSFLRFEGLKTAASITNIKIKLVDRASNTVTLYISDFLAEKETTDSYEPETGQGGGNSNEINITQGWAINDIGGISSEGGGERYTVLAPSIEGYPDLGGGKVTSTYFVFTNASGIARSALNDYKAFEFFIKLENSAGVPDMDYLTLEILQSYDRVSWVTNSPENRPVVKVPMAAVKACWVKITVPLSGFAGFTTESTLRTMQIRFSGITVGSAPDMYVSDILAVKEVSEINITQGWAINNTGGISNEGGGTRYTVLNPPIEDRPYLGGGKVAATAFVFTNASGIARNVLDGYTALEFYVKLENSDGVPNSEFLAFDILQSYDRISWVTNSPENRPVVKVSMAEIKTGWVKVSVPISSFGGFTSGTTLRTMMVRFSGVTVTGTPDLYMSDIVAVKSNAAAPPTDPDEVNITEGLTRSGTRITASDALIPGKPELSAGWIDNNYRTLYSGNVGLNSSYTVLKFYVKLERADIGGASNPNVDIRVTLNFGSGITSPDDPGKRPFIRNVSKAELAAGWMEFSVPLKEFNNLPALHTFSLTEIYIDIFDAGNMGANIFSGVKGYVSDVLAVQGSEMNITGIWNGGGNNADARRCETDTAIPVDLKGWRMTKDSNEAATTLAHTFIAGESYNISDFSDYNFIEFYVKLNRSDAITGSPANLALELTVNFSSGAQTVHNDTVSAASAAAGWTRISIPMSAFSMFASESGTFDNFTVRLTNCRQTALVSFAISDITAFSKELDVWNITEDWEPDAVNRVRLDPPLEIDRGKLKGWSSTFSSSTNSWDNHTRISFDYNPRSKTLFSDYSYLEFYFKIDSPDAFTGSFMHLSTAMKFGGAWIEPEEAVVQKIPKSAVSDGWVKVNIPLSAFAELGSSGNFEGLIVRLRNRRPGEAVTMSLTDILAVKIPAEDAYKPGALYDDRINLSELSGGINREFASSSSRINEGDITTNDPYLGGWQINITTGAISDRMRFYSDWNGGRALKDYQAVEFYVKTDGLMLSPETRRVHMRVGFGMRRQVGEQSFTFYDYAQIDNVNLADIENGWVKVVVPIEKFTRLNESENRDNYQAVCFQIENKSPQSGGILYISDIFAVKYDSYTPGTNEINSINRLTAAPQKENLTEFELAIDYDKSKNPFNPKEISLDAVFISPSGKTYSVPGFYYQAYEYQQGVAGTELGKRVGTQTFRIRYTPQETGTYSYSFKFKVDGGVTSEKNGSFAVGTDTKGKKGFIKVEPEQKRGFIYQDGSPYVPVGENVGWPEEKRSALGAYQYYSDVIKGMSENGANYIRIWMGMWCFSLYDIYYSQLNWSATQATSNNFVNRMDHAFLLDDVMKLAEDNGLHVSLALWQHLYFDDAYSSTKSWGVSPFALEMGGYLDDATEFFSDSRAREDAKIYARYVVARWGYSQGLFTYELFNEVDHTNGGNETPEAVLEWQGDMADYIRAADPYGHPVSSSTAGGAAEELNAAGKPLPGSGTSINSYPIMTDNKLDFINVHLYSTQFVGYIPTLQQHLYEKYKRPILVSELGLGGSDTLSYNDWDFISFTQIMWTGMMSGGSGTAMTWWWEFIHEFDMYHRIKPVSEFAKLIPWLDRNRRTIGTDDIELSMNQISSMGYQGENYLYLWTSDNMVRYPNYDDDFDEFDGVKLTANNLKNGKYTAKWFDTYDHGLILQKVVTVSNGKITLDMPVWSKDVALAFAPFVEGDKDIAQFPPEKENTAAPEKPHKPDSSNDGDGNNVDRTEVAEKGNEPIVSENGILTLDTVKKAIEQASGDIAVVRIYNEGILTDEMQEELINSGKNLQLEIMDDDGNVIFIWQFGTFTQTLGNIDLSINFNPRNATQIGKELNGLEHLIFSMNHTGALPSGTKVFIKNTTAFAKSDTLVIWYYNKETGKLEKLEKAISLVANGEFIGFEIDSCSEFVIVKQRDDNAIIKPNTDVDFSEKSSIWTYVIIAAAALFVFGATGGLIVILMRKRTAQTIG